MAKDSKYTPLKEHLEDCRMTSWKTSFAEIEKILGFILPKTAYKHHEWWGNEDPAITKHTQSKSWMEIGWNTDNVNLINKTITFCKGR